MSEAFDLVCHKMLLEFLTDMVIKNMFELKPTCRKATCKTTNHINSIVIAIAIPCKVGVPQGSILGPLLL